jgi:hypothetical protein
MFIAVAEKKSLRRYVIANGYTLVKHKKGYKEVGPKSSSYSGIYELKINKECTIVAGLAPTNSNRTKNMNHIFLVMKL